MRIENIPAFICGNTLDFFNYVMRDFILEMFEKNKDKVKSYDEFEVLKLDKHEHIVKIKKESKTRISQLECADNYIAALHRAQSNEGIYAQLQGHYAFAYAERLADFFKVKQSDILAVYKDFVSQEDDEEMNEYASELAAFIPKLHQFVIDKKRIKKDINSSKIKQRIKGYCDLDFYTYLYDNKLIVACYASATMYAIDFTSDGYVVYGERNDYGKEIEQKLDKKYDWDNEEYEPSFLKHLNSDLIIMTETNGEIVVYNEMVRHLHLIVEYIGIAEKLWVKVEDKNDSGDDDYIITIERRPD